MEKHIFSVVTFFAQLHAFMTYGFERKIHFLNERIKKLKKFTKSCCSMDQAVEIGL